jgi:hypothetical protein
VDVEVSGSGKGNFQIHCCTIPLETVLHPRLASGPDEEKVSQVSKFHTKLY